MTRQTVLLGALASVLVIALWWLFVYTPGSDDLAVVQDEIAAAEAEQAALRQRVAELEAVRSRAPETEAAIAQLLSIVPDSPALPAALRQITAAAEDAGLTVDALTTTRPTLVDETIGLYGSNITLTASGSYFQLVDFLRRLEDPAVTARGVSFQTMTAATGEYPTLSISLSGTMFSVLEPPPTPDDPAAQPATNDSDATQGESGS